MNNASGPDELTAALGADRVMVGFPSSGGYLGGHVMRVIPVRLASIPLGETDGRVTERTRRVAALLDTIRDNHTQIRTDMDAWLVTHVSLDEFRERVVPGGVATPPLDRLAAHVDQAVRSMPGGSRELPLRWGGCSRSAAPRRRSWPPGS
jgi:hypothetical protein